MRGASVSVGPWCVCTSLVWRGCFGLAWVPSRGVGTFSGPCVLSLGVGALAWRGCLLGCANARAKVDSAGELHRPRVGAQGGGAFEIRFFVAAPESTSFSHDGLFWCPSLQNVSRTVATHRVHYLPVSGR